MTNKIVCAAMRLESVGLIIPCVRHWDENSHILSDRLCVKTLEKKAIQGFLDKNGKFWNRKEAYKIAFKTGQIEENLRTSRELYSEDLY